MLNIVDYLKQFKPSMDRSKSKYYSEMQQLAYNLVRYLSMNCDKNEHLCQGNYNLTYLEENMTHENFKGIVNMMLRRIPMWEVKQMIREDWGEESANTVLKDDDELRNEYDKLVDKYDDLEHRYEVLKENIKCLLDEK